jgi:transposase
MFISVNINRLVDQQLAADHPLRRIKVFTDHVLASLSDDFDDLYAATGRPSVPPECLLRALLWQALFSIRSERQLEETIRYDLRCRWFVDVPLDRDAWDHSTFTKARESLLLAKLSEKFFERHVEFLRAAGLVSDDHLSVDGTLLGAWASHKSLVNKADLDKDGKPPVAPKGGRNAWVDFKGQKRSNETHTSVSDPDAKLASKGTGAKLSYELNLLAENRNALAVAFSVESPSGTSEREAAAALVEAQSEKGHTPLTVGADRKYAEGDQLVPALVAMGVTPHFAVRDDRPKALARAYQDTPGYPISLRCRMRIEEVFAFVKCVSGLAQVKVRGLSRVLGVAAIALAAYNLTRHASLRPA